MKGHVVWPTSGAISNEHTCRYLSTNLPLSWHRIGKDAREEGTYGCVAAVDIVPWLSISAICTVAGCIYAADMPALVMLWSEPPSPGFTKPCVDEAWSAGPDVAC